MPPAYEDRYYCGWEDCRKRYPVPSLARDCEDRHLEEDARKSLKSSA